MRIDKFWNNSYIEYESSGDRNKTLLGRYNNNLPKSDAWKIALIIAINIIYSKDVDEERVMHSKSVR